MDVIRWMVNRGASATAVTNDGWTAMHAAAHGGHLAVVTWLVEHGASIRERAMNGEEPLSLAAMSGQHEVVDFLVRAWVLQSGASSEPEDGSSLPRGLAETLRLSKSKSSNVDDAARRGVGPAAAFTAWRPRACGAAHPADLAPRLVSQCGHLRARLGDDGGRRGSAAAAAARRGESVSVAPPPPSTASPRAAGARRWTACWRRGGRGGPCVDGDRDDPGEEQQRDFGGGLHLLFSGADAAAAAAEVARPRRRQAATAARRWRRLSLRSANRSSTPWALASRAPRRCASRRSRGAINQCTVRRWQARRVLETS